jgi:hypothetical protein
MTDIPGLTGVGAKGEAIWDSAIWDEATWDFAETTQNELKIRKKGKDIQVQITNDKTNEPITIYGIVMEYQLKKP